MSDVTESLTSYIEILRGTMPTEIPLDSHSPLISQSPSAFARYIDHSCLAPRATVEDIDRLCAEAREYVFASVCVQPNLVPHAVSSLAEYNARCVRDDDTIGVTCVVGFPEGTNKTEEKVAQAAAAVAHGATELDMVMNYPMLIAGKYKDVFDDIAAVKEAGYNAARLRQDQIKTVTPPHNPLAPATPAEGILEPSLPLKVILETSQLTHDQIIAGTALATFAGAKWVKTSTGFKGTGARVEDVATMRAVCEAAAHGTKVKASGGIRTATDCIRMIRAGAERIGASAGVSIMQEVSAPEFDLGSI